MLQLINLIFNPALLNNAGNNPNGNYENSSSIFNQGSSNGDNSLQMSGFQQLIDALRQVMQPSCNGLNQMGNQGNLNNPSTAQSPNANNQGNISNPADGTTYMTKDPATGNLSIDSGLNFSKNSLQGLDMDGDGRVNATDAGPMGQAMDLNNDKMISPGENLSLAILQDNSFGPADGTVTSQEAAAADERFAKDPTKFKEQLNTIYNHQGANGTPSIAQRENAGTSPNQTTQKTTYPDNTAQKSTCPKQTVQKSTCNKQTTPKPTCNKQTTQKKSCK